MATTERAVLAGGCFWGMQHLIRKLLMIGFPLGAWQAALAYVLLVVSLAALIAKFGSEARSWS